MNHPCPSLCCLPEASKFLYNESISPYNTAKYVESRCWKDTEDGHYDLDASGDDAYWIEEVLQSSKVAPAGQRGQQSGVEADTHKAQSGSEVMQQYQLRRLQEEHNTTDISDYCLKQICSRDLCECKTQVMLPTTNQTHSIITAHYHSTIYTQALQSIHTHTRVDTGLQNLFWEISFVVTPYCII